MSKISIAVDPKNLGRDVVTIEDAQIITNFNNFSGEHGFREDDNRRTLCVIIDDPEAVRYFEEHGWNVKPRTGEDPRYLQIQVSYRFYNRQDQNPVPTILKKDPNSGHVMQLEEDTVGMLDTFRRTDGFEHCDLIFKGSPYEGPGGSGVTGYLQWMQVTPHYNEVEDTIERLRYSDAVQNDITEGVEMPF